MHRKKSNIELISCKYYEMGDRHLYNCRVHFDCLNKKRNNSQIHQQKIGESFLSLNLPNYKSV